MRSFDSSDTGTPEALFFSRLEALDTTTMLPIALLLFRSGELSAGRGQGGPQNQAMLLICAKARFALKPIL